MRVPEEEKVGFEVGSQLRDILLAEYVFVLIERRAVHQLETVNRQRTSLEASQVLQILREDRSHRPYSRHARYRVKPLQVVDPGAGFIVISAHYTADVGTDPLGYPIRGCTIADQ